MYTFFGNITKLFSYMLRVIQVVGFVYFIFYAIYWLCMVAHLSFAITLSPLYTNTQIMTDNLLKSLNISISNDYNLLHLNILISLFLLLVILILSNFIFIFTGSIERFFVDKSYQKGEREKK